MSDNNSENYYVYGEKGVENVKFNEQAVIGIVTSSEMQYTQVSQVLARQIIMMYMFFLNHNIIDT